MVLIFFGLVICLKQSRHTQTMNISVQATIFGTYVSNSGQLHGVTSHFVVLVVSSYDETQLVLQSHFCDCIFICILFLLLLVHIIGLHIGTVSGLTCSIFRLKQK